MMRTRKEFDLDALKAECVYNGMALSFFFLYIYTHILT